ncbi:MAG: hypothetical protein ACRD5K_09975 [Candidatus Acidiferrales bacterium]
MLVSAPVVGRMQRLMLLWIGSGISKGFAFCILWRALRTSTIRKYPYFYAYIASTLTSILLPIVYLVDRPSYDRWYWPIQFGTLVLGCGVIVEIFQQVLSPYPGAKRFAKLTAFTAFGGLFCLAIAYALFHLDPSTAAAGIELERNVRALQAIFLFAVLGIIFGYAIPVGRNIRGMIVGYGGYIGVSLISRAVEVYAAQWLRLVWLYVQAFSFEVSLAIWLVALWSYQPNPAPDPSVQIESDYEALASRTRRALNATRSYLGRASRI